jgi:hypothetical protein
LFSRKIFPLIISETKLFAMKIILFNSIGTFGFICLLSFSLYAQPCTTVTRITSFQYSAFIIGEQNTLTLRAEHGSIYLNGIFTLTSGALPAGLSLTGNKITGTPTAAGIYVFVIGAASAPGCPVFERTFSFNVGYNLPCADFEISVPSHSSPPQQLRRNGSIIFRTEHFDSVTYAAVSLPPGFTMSHTAGSYQAIVSGSAQYDGLHTVTVAAYTNKGCTDTLSYTWNVFCSLFAVDSISPEKPNLPYGIVGESYNQSFFISFGTPGIIISYTSGTLPPGLTFADHEISGIPTTPGIYTFELTATASPAGCTLIKQWYQIEVVEPNTVCKHYDAIAPLPEAIDSIIYYAGDPLSITFSASKDGVVDDSAIFNISVPLPGLTLNGNVLSGIPISPRTRRFTVAAYSEEGCPAYEQEYTMHVEWKEPCDAFSVDFLANEPGLTQVGMTSFYIFGSYSGWDSTRVWALEIPAGFKVDSTFTPDDQHIVYITGHAVHTGINKFVIAGTGAGGCRDTLVYAPDYTCLYPQPMIPSPDELSYASLNEPYYQLVGLESPYAFDIEYDNFRMDVTGGALPPGLILSDTTWVSGYIHGIPTTPGTYIFTISAMIETCSIIETTYTLAVRERVPFQTLTLHTMCSESTNENRWRIHNPNNFNIPVTWQPVYFYNGPPIPIVARANSDTYFYSYVINVPEPSLPGTIRLNWTDGDGTPRSIVKAASTELCDPPACVFASDVVSFHQGLQKNGYNVDDNHSAPYWTLGEPDAFDDNIGIHHFALGYNGFIVLRMTDVINDEAGNDLMVHEFSTDEPTFAEHPERAEVQVSKDGVNWVSLGLTSPATCQGTLDHAYDIAGKITWFRYVKVIDKTDRNARILNNDCTPTSVLAFNGLSDGFDLDAVTCGQGTTAAREAFADAAPSTHNNSIIYPNPVKDWLNIDLSNENLTAETHAQINIQDLSGRILYQNVHTIKSGSAHLDVSGYHTGMYILRLRLSDGKSGFYKFLKD